MGHSYFEHQRAMRSLCAVLVLTAGAVQADLTAEQVARREKCRAIIKSLYNHKGKTSMLPYVDFFCAEHERIEAEALANGKTWAKGFAGSWWYSLVYGAANFSLRCYATAPGNCAGPMDVKHRPLITDPKANIRYHVREQFLGWRLGYRGLGLCQYVFYPAAPRDWGGGRFRRTEALHRRTLEAWQRKQDPKPKRQASWPWRWGRERWA